MRKSTIVLIILDVLALIGFFLTYGPISYFRNYLVNTAMNTMTHQYFAYIFYNEEMVNKILSQNYFITIDEETNLDDIVIDTKPKDHYDNEYDEAILERTPGNNDYKIIPLKGKNYNGFLVAIYDPSKVKTVSMEKFGVIGERIMTMCNRDGGLVCINGGGVEDINGKASGKPYGPVIKNSKIIWDDGITGPVIGFNEDDKLVLVNSNAEDALNKHNLRDAVQFGPFLIVNGKPMEIVGDPWGMAPRVAIAQRKDGIVLFLVIDGENWSYNGATLGDLIEILTKYGAHNAANLDGGHSTTLIVKGKLYNNPPALAKAQGGRYVATGFGLIP